MCIFRFGLKDNISLSTHHLPVELTMDGLHAAQGPWEILQEYLVEDIIRIGQQDLELRGQQLTTHQDAVGALYCRSRL